MSIHPKIEVASIRDNSIFPVKNNTSNLHKNIHKKERNSNNSKLQLAPSTYTYNTKKISDISPVSPTANFVVSNENSYNRKNSSNKDDVNRISSIVSIPSLPDRNHFSKHLIVKNLKNALSEIGSGYPQSLLSSESTRFMVLNSTTDDDPFDPGGGDDNPGGYNDAPVGDGLLILLILAILYSAFIKIQLKKNRIIS